MNMAVALHQINFIYFCSKGERKRQAAAAVNTNCEPSISIVCRTKIRQAVHSCWTSSSSSKWKSFQPNRVDHDIALPRNHQSNNQPTAFQAKKKKKRTNVSHTSARIIVCNGMHAHQRSSYMIVVVLVIVFAFLNHLLNALCHCSFGFECIFESINTLFPGCCFRCLESLCSNIRHITPTDIWLP